MSVANYNTSPTPKCLVCCSSIGPKRTKNSEEFIIVFETFCRLLKIVLSESMQWNFEQDCVPFCESCSFAVEKLKDICDQIESLQKERTNILSRIKHEIQTSGKDTDATNQLIATDRINYFRHLVTSMERTGSSSEEKCPINTEDCYIKLEPGYEVETQLDGHKGNELSFLERINEPCEFENEDIESDPLLITVKLESDCLVDVEAFTQDNLTEGVTESMILDRNTNVSSSRELEIRAEEKTKTDPENRCQFCQKNFCSKLYLDRHIKQRKCLDGDSQTPSMDRNEPGVEQDKQNNPCAECAKGDATSEEFSSFHSLTCYKRIHMGAMQFKCDYCDKMYTGRHQFMIHRRRHTVKRLFKCEICSQTFTQSRDLVYHEGLHSGEEPYKCDVCDMTFRRSQALTVHKRLHTGEEPFKCHVCNKTFTQLQNLTTHQRIHTGEKPYKCDVCNMTFRLSQTLIIHKRLHTGEEPFKCDVCNKTFTRSRTLTIHTRIHTGEKPYKCDVCAEYFKDSTLLLRHERKHTGERPYQCEICLKTFSIHSGLRSHKRVHRK